MFLPCYRASPWQFDHKQYVTYHGRRDKRMFDFHIHVCRVGDRGCVTGGILSPSSANPQSLLVHRNGSESGFSSILPQITSYLLCIHEISYSYDTYCVLVCRPQARSSHQQLDAWLFRLHCTPFASLLLQKEETEGYPSTRKTVAGSALSGAVESCPGAKDPIDDLGHFQPTYQRSRPDKTL